MESRQGHLKTKTHQQSRSGNSERKMLLYHASTDLNLKLLCSRFLCLMRFLKVPHLPAFSALVEGTGLTSVLLSSTMLLCQASKGF